MGLVLYSYWRAGAPYRVRIGLALKGLAYEYRAVDLVAGDQNGPDYRGLNPQQLTPALVTDEGQVLTQSLAILEWLEDRYPAPPLLPASAADRAVVRAMAGIIAADIHPLNNARVLKQLKRSGVEDAGRAAWTRRWIEDGFAVLEPLVARHGAGFAFGDQPGLADCCLVPQVYSARRFEVDMAPYPTLSAVAERASTHPAFIAAHPDRQPDAP